MCGAGKARVVSAERHFDFIELAFGDLHSFHDQELAAWFTALFSPRPAE
jgi:hypothetical protein